MTHSDEIERDNKKRFGGTKYFMALTCVGKEIGTFNEQKMMIYKELLLIGFVMTNYRASSALDVWVLCMDVPQNVRLVL